MTILTMCIDQSGGKYLATNDTGAYRAISRTSELEALGMLVAKVVATDGAITVTDITEKVDEVSE